jgi:ATP-binding protein involved in chromosome partitioning
MAGKHKGCEKKLSDPRLTLISNRFEDIDKVIAVSSGKGGVGKSLLSVALAFCLRDKGKRVGLLDLDFTSPSTHVILGARDLYPEEEKGIKPPEYKGLSYMSIVYYSADNPVPLRGADTSDAIIELLAITRWEKLDYLVIDMPPGIGDATLDMLRLIPRISFLVVTTPSILAYESVRKLLSLLKDQNIPIIGVVENMVMKSSSFIRSQVEDEKLRFLGSIDYDDTLENSLGNPDKLRETKFYKQLAKISAGI